MMLMKSDNFEGGSDLLSLLPLLSLLK